MKKWYYSKTVWFNFIAFIGVLLQAVTGHVVLDAGTQGIVLTAINVVLRFITKHELN